jgi:predicted glycoside hydrolase/deacetylase ChbG (UPF0249 family)
MKRVILNADDFGLVQGVNKGIIQAHREGVLSSASLMANAPGFENAVDLAAQNRGLGVGVHLNILRGRPLSESRHVKSLVTKEGNFCPSVFRLYWKLKSGRIDLGEIEKELRMQIERVMDASIVPSHLDSEKHSHMIDPLFTLTLKLAKDYGIAKMRFIREFCLTPKLMQIGKALFISLSGSARKRRLEAEGIKSTDHFCGICASGRMSAERLQKTLSCLKDGVTEIMVHPGFISQDLIELEKTFGSYYINRYRELELKALLDSGVKKIFTDRGIQLMSFHQL